MSNDFTGLFNKMLYELARTWSVHTSWSLQNMSEITFWIANTNNLQPWMLMERVDYMENIITSILRDAYTDGVLWTWITRDQTQQRKLHKDRNSSIRKQGGSCRKLEIEKQEISIPEIAGVSSPSPITIQVPRRTKISSAVCSNLYFSSAILTLELFFCSGGCSSLYVDSASSATCLLGRRLTFACLHIKEYRAKVPPAYQA